MAEELLFALIGDMAIAIVTHVFISIYSSMYLVWEAIETHVRTKKKTETCMGFCLKVYTEVLKLLFGVVIDNRENSMS